MQASAHSVEARLQYAESVLDLELDMEGGCLEVSVLFACQR